MGNSPRGQSDTVLRFCIMKTRVKLLVALLGALCFLAGFLAVAIGDLIAKHFL